MKIGIDIRTLMDANYSGVSEYTYELVREILKQDSNNNEYFLFYNSFKPIGERLPAFEEFPHQKVNFRYPNKLLNYVGFKMLDIPKVDQRLGLDLVFSPHINFISLSGKSRSVLTIHDLSFLRYPEFFSRRKNFWHNCLNIKRMAKKFDYIVAISENTRDDIVELLEADPSKVSVIYSGLRPEFNPEPLDESRKKDVISKYGLPDKFIFFLATIEPRKNLLSIISAFEEYLDKTGQKDIKLVLAGGRGWKSAEIYQAYKNSPARDSIKFLGYVERDDRAALYKLALLFVFPSFYEGFGFPPLEAMACGTPVITSFSSSLPEVCGKAAFLVDPYDSSEILRGFDLILGNKVNNEEIIRKGIENAKRFRWELTANQYISLFNS